MKRTGIRHDCLDKKLFCKNRISTSVRAVPTFTYFATDLLQLTDLLQRNMYNVSVHNAGYSHKSQLFSLNCARAEYQLPASVVINDLYPKAGCLSRC
jgi:hypothetical protein